MHFPIDDKNRTFFDVVDSLFSCIKIMEVFHSNIGTIPQNKMNEIINDEILKIDYKTFSDLINEYMRLKTQKKED